MNPAPPKPPSKNAERKAWQAYYSELRRWAKALERWEADLDEREAAFERAVEDAPDDAVQRYAGNFVEDDCCCDEGTCNIHPNQDYGEDEMDCDCDNQAAIAGCDCPKCEMMRKSWLEQDKKKKKVKEPIGDDVKWLENLWKLEDKRK